MIMHAIARLTASRRRLRREKPVRGIKLEHGPAEPEPTRTMDIHVRRNGVCSWSDRRSSGTLRNSIDGQGCPSYGNRVRSRLRLAVKRLIVLLAVCALVTLTGCWSSSDQEVVVYTALDKEFSEPILEDFEEETGINVLPKYDTESTKTVGLVTEIMAEKNNPRCDLFWNNEIMHTLRLEQEGLLEVYEAPAAGMFPSTFVSPERTWFGFASRARILIVNTELLPEEAQRPTSVADLADPKWKDKCGIAKPLFGTTATHAAVLFDEWGDERAKEFFTEVNGNAQVLSGNKQVAQAVARGQLAWGITDTDDAAVELDKGEPVEIVFPDQQGDEAQGALFIPNTLAIIKGGPNTENARKLVDYLLTPEVEIRLAEGASAQFPLRADVAVESRVSPEGELKWIEADFRAAAKKWPEAAEFLKGLFAGG